MKGADSEQPVGVLCYQWVGCRDQDSLVFLILGVGRFREDQPTRGPYVEARENVFFIIRDLKLHLFK